MLNADDFSRLPQFVAISVISGSRASVRLRTRQARFAHRMSAPAAGLAGYSSRCRARRAARARRLLALLVAKLARGPARRAT
jgi:hypothetical protein